MNLCDSHEARRRATLAGGTVTFDTDQEDGEFEYVAVSTARSPTLFTRQSRSSLAIGTAGLDDTILCSGGYEYDLISTTRAPTRSPLTRSTRMNETLAPHVDCNAAIFSMADVARRRLTLDAAYSPLGRDNLRSKTAVQARQAVKSQFPAVAQLIMLSLVDFLWIYCITDNKVHCVLYHSVFNFSIHYIN